VSTVTPHSILPRKPLGRTFVVAISLLGAFALIQLLAVFGHWIPSIRQQLSEKALENQRASLAAFEQSRPVAQPQPANTPFIPQNTANDQQVKRMITEADRVFRIGDYDGALKLLEEAETAVPGDPKVLQRKALVFERLNQPADAIVALESALRYPGLPASDVATMEKKLDQLSTAVGSSIERPAQSTAALESNLAAMEENGVPVGSSLGIVDVRLSDIKIGQKGMQIAIKSRESSAINVRDVKILVFFYEETAEGEVNLTESKPIVQWVSPPIDWADNEPELIKLQYTTPGEDTGRKYFGYVVGVYYNNELQDFRSEPAKLAKDYPLQLFLKGAE